MERIIGRLVHLRGEPVVSLTLKESRRDQTRNLPPAEATEWLRSELGRRFRAALLETTQADWQLTLSEDRPARLVRHAPRQTDVPERDHDRSKAHRLADSAGDWLKGLGLLDSAGRPFPSRADKLHQVRRYTEILGHLVQSADWPTGTALRVADMGCGRGYLTFAVWQLLRRQLGFEAVVTGIETRADLVQNCSRLATGLGLEGLGFLAGTIRETPLGALDVLIALHACNTATDDALLRGIDSECRLLVVSPCCHQEVRPQLEAPEPFTGPLAHGLLAERFAEWLTDSLRVLFLEWAGYQVRVIEFVASEHTPRNVLLAGVRAGTPFHQPALRDRIVALKNQFGLRHHALDALLTR